MKKLNNKGFSLVELIIVIAIMAIIAGALAPTLIKYVAKSKRSTDVRNGETIRTGIQDAMLDMDAITKSDAPGTDGFKYDTWYYLPTSYSAGSFWSYVEDDISGGLEGVKEPKTNRILSDTTPAISGVKFCIMVEKSTTIHVGIVPTSGSNYKDQVFPCVPEPCAEMGGRSDFHASSSDTATSYPH